MERVDRVIRGEKERKRIGKRGMWVKDDWMFLSELNWIVVYWFLIVS